MNHTHQRTNDRHGQGSLAQKQTVVIPTYNESDNLPPLIDALLGLPLPALHLLVVDDNSPDGTGHVADQLAAKSGGRMSVIHRPGQRSFGMAYIHGFERALADGATGVAQMDADFSHTPARLVDLFAALSVCDVALGSRYISGGSLDKDWPAWRKALSCFGNFYACTILGLPVRDATGGFRAWRRSALERIPLRLVRSNGYAFQVEMIYLAHLTGSRLHEIPIHFAERSRGQSKMSFRVQVEAALRVWQMLIEYRALDTLDR